jgi:hypothetical protein
MMQKFSFIFSFLISLPAFSAQLNLAPYFRTYPLSTSIEASLSEDILIWKKENIDETPEFWKFGYIQPKITLAAHGKAEASLQLAPISILEFSSSYSRTSRFYDTRPFDCAANLCKGFVDRSAYGVRLALAAGKWKSLLAYRKTKMMNEDNSKRTVDESEVLWTEPGKDELEASSIYISKSDTPFGVYARKARYLGAQVGSEAAYFVLRHKMDDVSYALGAGRYASDFSVPEFSVYAGVIWNFTLNGKKSLALF